MLVKLKDTCFSSTIWRQFVSTIPSIQGGIAFLTIRESRTYEAVQNTRAFISNL